jgi:hypothetical protein
MMCYQVPSWLPIPAFRDKGESALSCTYIGNRVGGVAYKIVNKGGFETKTWLIIFIHGSCVLSCSTFIYFPSPFIRVWLNITQISQLCFFISFLLVEKFSGLLKEQLVTVLIIRCLHGVRVYRNV